MQKGVAEGTADVTELLIENAQKVVDAKAATEDPSAKPDDLKDIEISEEVRNSGPWIPGLQSYSSDVPPLTHFLFWILKLPSC